MEKEGLLGRRGISHQIPKIRPLLSSKAKLGSRDCSTPKTKQQTMLEVLEDADGKHLAKGEAMVVE